jgi:hypothetical protein
MIYSPDNSFVMFQNLKVGGSSLKLALLDILPDTTFCTDIDMSTKAANLDLILNKTTIKKLGVCKKNLIDLVGTTDIATHMGVSNFIKYFPEIDFNLLTSCVFVRNPFDMVFSMFIMKLKQDFLLKKFYKLSNKEQEGLLDEYFTTNVLKSTKGIYTSFGSIDVTHVFKYENGLAQEINTILPGLGLPAIPEVSYEAKKFKSSDITYRTYFKERHLDIIRKEWWWEFETFNYEPYPSDTLPA